MAKLSHGPASHAVKASQGPPSSSLHFYCTNYSRHHGRHSEVQGELGTVARRTRGTGYIANYRPTLYYTSQLDHHDNPDMISLLADNYASLTTRHYAGFGGVSGREPLPQRTHSCLSGYSCNLPRTTPTAKQGQGKLSTETHTKFIPKPFRNEALRGSQYTHREETGFTHAQNIEPVTFRPREAFANDLSPQATWRPTGRSVMKKDFSLPSQHPGDEGMPLSLGRANCSSGYVKGSNFPSTVQPKSTEMVGYTVASQLQPSPLAILSRQDPTHFSTIIHPDPFSSYTHYCLETGCKSDMKGRGGVGSKELTGFSENNQPLLEPQDRDSGRFSTHYHSQFPRPPLHSRPGGVSGGVQAAAPNGFTKGTAVHHFEKGQVNTAALLRSMHPSQARVVLCRDPCYDDHTHDSKHHTPTTKTQP